MTTHQLAKYLIESTPDVPVNMFERDGGEVEVEGAIMGNGCVYLAFRESWAGKVSWVPVGEPLGNPPEPH